MKIRSAVPENGCLIFDGRKNNKKAKQKTKNNCKTYTHPPPTGRRLRKKHSAFTLGSSSRITDIAASLVVGVG